MKWSEQIVTAACASPPAAGRGVWLPLGDDPARPLRGADEAGPGGGPQAEKRSSLHQCEGHRADGPGVQGLVAKSGVLLHPAPALRVSERRKGCGARCQG